MVGDNEKELQPHRRPVKPLSSQNNYSKWKHKLRENCFRRVRDDRSRLLWKFRLPDAEKQSASREDSIKSALNDIVSEELRKIHGSSLDGNSALLSENIVDDMIWEYDGLHTAYQGDCEEILLEMQKIFYDELRKQEIGKGTWEDEEDEYLAHAVYEHMQLNGDKVTETVWCPICKQGELHENRCDIYCNYCDLRLKRGDEVDLNLLRVRLGEAHAEHLDRGCRLKPEFSLETKFDITALYIKCQTCNTLDIVI